MLPRLRRLLGVVLVSLAVATLPGGHARAEVPVTGWALPGLEGFDRAVLGLLDRWKIPGASLAVAKDGRLVLLRGYGLADAGQRRPVTPDLRFRLASLSKSLTAAAILKLVEHAKLDLDAPALPLLGDLAPPPDEIVDARVHQITVRHLLNHRAGWNRDISGDPSFDSKEILNDPDCRRVIRMELTRPLDFTPGTGFAYSNTGYCLLGRIIEKVSGASYEAFVQRHVLDPAGIRGMAVARRARFHADEPTYYQTPGSSVSPYAGIALDAIDSMAGWVARPVDYLRYFMALGSTNTNALLRPESFSQMTAKPPVLRQASHWYGLGVRVQARSGGLDLWHHGSMPGTQTEAVWCREGFAWVIAFNARPMQASTFSDDIDSTIWAAARQVQEWPEGDLEALGLGAGGS